MQDGTDRWRIRYSRRLLIVDAAVIVWAVAGAQVVRFGFDAREVAVGPGTASYLTVSVILVLAWWLMLAAWGTRDSRILGSGPEEYKRVSAASLWLFGLIAIFSYVFGVETARGYVGLALPAGILGLLLARWLVRQHLSIERASGKSFSRVLIIGGMESVEHLIRSLRSQPAAGYLPVAAYILDLPAGADPPGGLRVPVVGQEANLSSILQAIGTASADTVAISSEVPLSPQLIRHLGWELAAQGTGLILAPALTDVAGPRIHTQPVAGLPLIHVSTPRLDGGSRVVKRLFDIAASCALIVISLPLLLAVALAVRLESAGPILFKQTRIGLEGKEFSMRKFRSMVVDAEQRAAEIRALNESDGVLFKIEHDPRITKVGRHLRKLSLDELPQLFNVLAGSMSLVGPRPPLPREVDAYEQDVHRRLLVKPGITGLWQVSGRSLLSWQDTVRLDLYYVENWSLIADIVILLRTFRAVVLGRGAY